MSTIALTRPLRLFGVYSPTDSILGKVSCIQFLIQGVGLVIAIVSVDIRSSLPGFFLYGTGLAGSFVLREVIWANFFGRASLGKVRGLSHSFLIYSRPAVRLSSAFFPHGQLRYILHNLFLRSIHMCVLILFYNRRWT